MNISSIKSSKLLPISTKIKRFFNREGFEYKYAEFGDNDVGDETCLYDDGFALVKAVELWTVPSVSLNGLLIKEWNGETLNAQYTSKFRNDLGEAGFFWDLNRVIQSIELPEPRLLDYITKIKITGLTIVEVQQFYENLEKHAETIDKEWKNKTSEIKGVKTELYEIELDKDIAAQSISDLEARAESIKADINEKQQEKLRLEDSERQLKVNVNYLEEEVAKEKSNLKEAEKETSKGRRKSSMVKDDIETLTQEVNKLQLEKFRYSEDFDTFKQELSLQNTLFLALISLFMIIGSTIVYSLLHGSYDLLRAFNSGTNIYELILSRIPTVLIHSMVIFYIGKWINLVIQGLIDNLNDLKKLKQLVYLVTEVTESQAIGLDVHYDSSIRYKQRVSEKMAIVRDVLCIIPQNTDSKPNDVDTNRNTSDYIVDALKAVGNK